MLNFRRISTAYLDHLPEIMEFLDMICQPPRIPGNILNTDIPQVPPDDSVFVAHDLRFPYVGILVLWFVDDCAFIIDNQDSLVR